MLITVAIFAAAVVVILLLGPRMAEVAQELATATGLGGAMFGVLFLALATDLPEIAFTPTAVLDGHPTLAIGTLLGSTAAQVLTIAVADVVNRHSQVMRDGSSPSATAQSALLVAILSVPLLAVPLDATVGSMSIMTPLLVTAYLGGITVVRRIGAVAVQGQDKRQFNIRSLWLRFGAYAVLLSASGVALERTTSSMSSALGLTATAGGALMAGVASSLPEFVTVVAAVRRGALSLAIGNAIGSSIFDVALLGWADAFYTDGSIFRLLGPQEVSLIGLALVLTALVFMGFARAPRSEKHAAMESYVSLGGYLAVAAMLLFGS